MKKRDDLEDLAIAVGVLAPETPRNVWGEVWLGLTLGFMLTMPLLGLLFDVGLGV